MATQTATAVNFSDRAFIGGQSVKSKCALLASTNACVPGGPSCYASDSAPGVGGEIAATGETASAKFEQNAEAAKQKLEAVIKAAAAASQTTPPAAQKYSPENTGRSVNFSQISAAKPAAARVNDVLGIPGFSCQRLMDVGRKGNRAVDSSRTGVDGESGSAFALPHVLAESGGLSARGGPPSQFVCRGANQGRFAEADLQRNHGKPRRGEVFQGPDLSESGAGCGFVSGREGKDGPVLWLHSRRAGLAAEGQVA